jgi:hypothetical protein
MDSLLRDLKFSVRSLLKRPALTIIAVVTLAVGIGANSAIFSTINSLLLKPLPFPDPDRIVALWDKVPSRELNETKSPLPITSIGARRTRRLNSSEYIAGGARLTATRKSIHWWR